MVGKALELTKHFHILDFICLSRQLHEDKINVSISQVKKLKLKNTWQLSKAMQLSNREFTAQNRASDPKPREVMQIQAGEKFTTKMPRAQWESSCQIRLAVSRIF